MGPARPAPRGRRRDTRTTCTDAPFPTPCAAPHWTNRRSVRKRTVLRHYAVHLEDLGVLAVHVDAVGAGQVVHVLGVGVAPVLLRRIPLERSDLALDVPLLERDVQVVLEVVVV